MLQYKSVPFEVKEIVDVTGGGWEVSGYASTFGGSPDAYGDVIARGAFAESISVRPTKFLYEHTVPIGKQLELREDDKGLFGRWTVVDTTHGVDAYKLMKSGVLDSLSIGYFTQDAEYDTDGVRILKRVDLYEVSCVAIPANPNATITDVKHDHDADVKATWSSAYVNDLPDSAFAVILPGGKKDDSGKTTPRSLRKLPHHDASGSVDLPHLRNALAREPQTDMSDAAHARASAHLSKHAKAEGVGQGGKSFEDHSGDVRVAVAEWLDRARSGSDIRVADGKSPLTAARRATLLEVRGSLAEAGVAIDELLASDQPGRIHVGLELRRRRYARLGILELVT